jgi:hypothetical protein
LRFCNAPSSAFIAAFLVHIAEQIVGDYSRSSRAFCRALSASPYVSAAITPIFTHSLVRSVSAIPATRHANSLAPNILSAITSVHLSPALIAVLSSRHSREHSLGRYRRSSRIC